MLGKQVNGSGRTDRWEGCTVQYSIKHVSNAVVSGCCTHGRTQRVEMEQYAKAFFVSDLCGTWLNVNVWVVRKASRICGCCRFKKLKVLAVVRRELECLNEVWCIAVSYSMP